MGWKMKYSHLKYQKEVKLKIDQKRARYKENAQKIVELQWELEENLKDMDW